MSETTIPERPGESNFVVDKVENGLLFSRYFLLPMYVGLSAAMLLYCYVFAVELFHLFHQLSPWAHHAAEQSLDNIMQLSILSLLDMTMIANLIVMVSIGGYSIFIRELASFNRAPRFLKTLTSGTLKIKMSASLVGISAISLVRIFIDIDHVSWDTLLKQLTIHGSFILSVLAFTWMEAKLHPVSPSKAH